MADPTDELPGIPLTALPETQVLGGTEWLMIVFNGENYKIRSDFFAAGLVGQTVTPSDLALKADKTELQIVVDDLGNYKLFVTERFAEKADALALAQLAQIVSGIDVSSYATTLQLNQAIASAIQPLATLAGLEAFAETSASTYATKTELNTLGSATTQALAALSTDLNTRASATALAQLSDQVTNLNIPDEAVLVTQQQLSDALADKAGTTEVSAIDQRVATLEQVNTAELVTQTQLDTGLAGRVATQTFNDAVQALTSGQAARPTNAEVDLKIASAADNNLGPIFELHEYEKTETAGDMLVEVVAELRDGRGYFLPSVHLEVHVRADVDGTWVKVGANVPFVDNQFNYPLSHTFTGLVMGDTREMRVIVADKYRPHADPVVVDGFVVEYTEPA